MLARIRYLFRDGDFNTSQCSLWLDASEKGLEQTALALSSRLQSLSDAELYQFTIEIYAVRDNAIVPTTGDVTRHLLIVCRLETDNYYVLDIPSPREELFPLATLPRIQVRADISLPAFDGLKSLLPELSDEFATPLADMMIAGLAL